MGVELSEWLDVYDVFITFTKKLNKEDGFVSYKAYSETLLGRLSKEME